MGQMIPRIPALSQRMSKLSLITVSVRRTYILDLWTWPVGFGLHHHSTSVSTLRVPPRQSVDFLSLAQTSRLNFSCKLLNNGRLSRRKYVTGVWKFNSG